MRQRLSLLFVALIVSTVGLMLPAPAHAGIIVTVGKPSPEDASRRSKPGMNISTPDKNTGGTTCSGDTTSNDKNASSSTCPKIDPVTGLPIGWKCVPIGGGLLYCEGPGAGAGPGEGGAGAWDPDSADYDDYGDEDDMYDDADDEVQAFGCSGAGASSGLFGLLGAVGALVFMIRARRR